MLYRYKKSPASADYDDVAEQYTKSNKVHDEEAIAMEENPFHRPSDIEMRKSEIFGHRTSDYASPVTPSSSSEEFVGEFLRRNSRGSNPLDVHSAAYLLRARKRSSLTGGNVDHSISPPVSARSTRSHGVAQLSLGVAGVGSDSTALLSDRDDYDAADTRRPDSVMTTPRAPLSSRGTGTPSIYQIAVDSLMRLATPRSAYVSPRAPYYRRDDRSEDGHLEEVDIDDDDESMDENAPLSARNFSGSKKRL